MGGLRELGKWVWAPVMCPLLSCSDPTVTGTAFEAGAGRESDCRYQQPRVSGSKVLSVHAHTHTHTQSD